MRVSLVVLLVALSACARSERPDAPAAGGTTAGPRPTPLASSSTLESHPLGVPRAVATISAIRSHHTVSAPHFVHRSENFSFSGRPTTIEAFHLSPYFAKSLRVFDLVSLQTSAVYRSYALREATEALKALLLIDAGSAGNVGGIPKAIGLIVSGGRVVSPISRSAYGTGIVCISEAGRVNVLWARDYDRKTCWNAVQTGPLVIEPGGRVGIYANDVVKHLPHHHSLLAVGPDGSVDIMWTSDTHLYDIAEYLKANRYVAAINLGSDGGVIANDPPAVLGYGQLQNSIPASIGLLK